jgi:hypothetical protein
MKKLEDFIGKKISVAILDSANGWYDVKLDGVETGGIWIHGTQLDSLLGHIPKRSVRPTLKPPTRPVIFLPFARIVTVYVETVDLDSQA